MLQFIDCARVIARSLAKLVNNLSEEFIELNVNTDMMIKQIIKMI